jgi:uncharacterized protein YciI
MSRIVKQITVETSRERAFRVFTAGIDRWWPKTHHIGASPLVRSLIEPHAGGRWYSVCADGSEVNVGRVLTWEPPTRLVLSWQITADWKYDPSFSTEVEVGFVADGPRRTHVTLEHRQLDRYGAQADAMRRQFEDKGWSHLLELFAGSTQQPKFAMFYTCTPSGLAKAHEHLGTHRARLDEFNARGELLMAGNLLEGSPQALGIFTTKAAADEFVAGDPFVANGVVDTVAIVPWNEVLF